MIRYPATMLAAGTAARLRQYQAGVDAVAGYAARVAEAKAKFKARNITSNRTFQQVRAALSRMCSGARRCMYCEDSVADEVEHVRPKDLYPDVVFVWDNYVYACGPCNGGKGSQYLVVVPPAQVVDVTRRPRAAVTAPPAGSPVFLDPRTEDGMVFMQLDLTGTFRFIPLSPTGSVDRERAENTIRILKLNDRDYLVDARREAFGSYVARVKEYRYERDAGAAAGRLTTLRNALLRMGHPTVWAEMKRQNTSVPVLRQLFRAVPEALTWRVP